MGFWIRTFLAVGFVILFAFASHADIYKYRDADGRLIFVGDKNQIPSQYHEDVTSVEETDEPPIVYDDEDLPIPAEEPSAAQQLENRRNLQKEQEYQTHVTISGNRVLVPVEVSMGNRTIDLSLLLDTGATRTVLHRQSIAELDLPSGKEYKARVAGGGVVKSSRIQFRKIKVGPFEFPKVRAMVIDFEGNSVPFDGMLGMDFLKNHPYKIDYDNEVIIWDRSSDRDR